jgi:hypothetical protein
MVGIWQGAGQSARIFGKAAAWLASPTEYPSYQYMKPIVKGFKLDKPHLWRSDRPSSEEKF